MTQSTENMKMRNSWHHHRKEALCRGDLQSWTSWCCRRCASQWCITKGMARCILSLTAHMYGLKRATERGDWGQEKRLVWDMGDRRFWESEILLDGGT